MDCQPTHSLQSRAALLQAEMHMYNVQMDLHQYLTNKRRMRRGGQRIRYWSAGEMRSQIFLVESCTRPFMSVLCSVCPLCILYAF